MKLILVYLFARILEAGRRRWSCVTHWTEAINSVPLVATSLSFGIDSGFQTTLQHLATSQRSLPFGEDQVYQISLLYSFS